MKEVAQRINACLIKNNITTTGLRVAQTLAIENVAIETTIKEEVEKLRGEDRWIIVLGSKAKLVRKKYGVIAIEISTIKIDFKKIRETNKRFVIQNANMWIRIKIESIF